MAPTPGESAILMDNVLTTPILQHVTIVEPNRGNINNVSNANSSLVQKALLAGEMLNMFTTLAR